MTYLFAKYWSGSLNVESIRTTTSWDNVLDMCRALRTEEEAKCRKNKQMRYYQDPIEVGFYRVYECYETLSPVNMNKTVFKTLGKDPLQK
jgi:hypothetical protein